VQTFSGASSSGLGVLPSPEEKTEPAQGVTAVEELSSSPFTAQGDRILGAGPRRVKKELD